MLILKSWLPFLPLTFSTRLGIYRLDKETTAQVTDGSSNPVYSAKGDAPGFCDKIDQLDATVQAEDSPEGADGEATDSFAAVPSFEPSTVPSSQPSPRPSAKKNKKKREKEGAEKVTGSAEPSFGADANTIVISIYTSFIGAIKLAFV